MLIDMLLAQIILTSTQLISFGFTFIMIVVAVVTLIIKINQSNQKRFDAKLDISVFKAHEVAQDRDYKVLDLQLNDIYKDLERRDTEMKQVLVFMARIDENLKHINNKLEKFPN